MMSVGPTIIFAVLRVESRPEVLLPCMRAFVCVRTCVRVNVIAHVCMCVCFFLGGAHICMLGGGRAKEKNWMCALCVIRMTVHDRCTKMVESKPTCLCEDNFYEFMQNLVQT
jgi:hypothetical protein